MKTGHRRGRRCMRCRLRAFAHAPLMRSLSCAPAPSPRRPWAAYRSSTAASAGRGPAHRLRGEALDHVSLDDVVESRQSDAALVVLCDFTNVVADPTERFDPVGRDALAAPPDTGVAPANDPPVGDERTRDDR